MDKSVDELLAELAAAPLLDPPELVSRRWHRAIAKLPPPAPTPSARHWWPTPRRLAVACAAASAAALLLTVQSADQVSTTAPPLTTALAHPNQIGELADPAHRAACLAKLGLPNTTVLSAHRITWQGHPVVQLLLATPTPGQVRAVTVTPDCGHVLTSH